MYSSSLLVMCPYHLSLPSLKSWSRWTFVTKENKFKRRTQRQDIYVRRRQGYASAQKRHFDKDSDLVYIHKNGVIGDVELVAGFEEYACSYVAASEVVETFVLDTKNIKRLFQRRNKHTMKLLSESVLDKMTAQKGRPRRRQQSACATVCLSRNAARSKVGADELSLRRKTTDR